MRQWGWGRPHVGPLALATHATIMNHVVIAEEGTPRYSQHFVTPLPGSSTPPILDNPGHSEALSFKLMPGRQEIYEPSNPNHHQIGTVPKTSGNKCYAVADTPLLEWSHICDEFLDKLLQYDGRGDLLQVLGCPGCDLPGISGMYRCNDCFDHDMVCHQCCVQRHEHLPLHKINVWNGSFFECTTLQDMGLTVYLGHKGCLMPKDGPVSFTVIHH
ncbi:hypothetical protein BS47DRAFT_1365256 [Hydnum rufescens UP504]|uniref:Uncharacterized protein n=1 Tax=Hydnum rufescens UP504 TaxID=1448309 RepID=A0A9P6DSG0_9AGAM|nr:hypothetical protein BS47DRAFT_1365256 [Hydnum rufescens UP504]